MDKLKELIEKRNAKAAEMNELVKTATNELRALTEEEDSQFKSLENEVRSLDALIEKAQNEAQMINPGQDPDDDTRANDNDDDVENREISDFAAYIRSEITGEKRDVTNLTMGDNGAVVPHTIANMIIKKVVEISPIYERATKFNVKGTLSIPYYDESDGSITVAYANEFEDLVSSSAKFASIELTGHLAGALTKISRSLLNNSDFALVQFVVNDMAEKIAVFIEKALLFGDDKQDGLKGITKTIKATADPKADDLIDIQDSIKDAFQANAIWIMGSATRTKIRKLKDNEGRYMLNTDLTSPFGYVLLGKPVYVTDAITDDTIFYGDFSGLAVKNVESPEIQILNELFALSHVVGAVVWFEMDSKVMDAQKMVKWGKNVQTISAPTGNPVIQTPSTSTGTAKTDGGTDTK